MEKLKDKISVVIPLYNEVESLRELHRRLSYVMASICEDYELIFVDDGSFDGSYEVLGELHRGDEHVKVIKFRRNFGKADALAAGFENAQGKIIITIDADLQDLPEEIPKLIAKLEEGYDLVSGWKRKREDSLGKRLPSRIFNFLTSLLTGISIHDFNCGLKCYRRQVIDEIKVYGEMHRYIPVLASYRGFRIGEVEVAHRRRKHGKSKYGPERLFGGFFDLLTVIMLTRYNRKPLHIFGILGLILTLIGFAICAYLTVGWFMGQWIGENRPLLILGVLMIIVGIQLIFFGLLAEMIAFATRREKDYVILAKLGFDGGVVEPIASVASVKEATEAGLRRHAGA